MAEQWFVKKGGKKHGPFTTDQLKKLASSGKIDRDDLLWKEGMEKWVTCGSAKGLFGTPPAVPKPAAPPPRAANPLDDFDAGHPAAAFADFEVPTYVPTPEEPPPIKPVESATASYTPVKAARRMDYAGLGARFVAWFIDSQVIGLPAVIAMFLLIGFSNDPKQLQLLILSMQLVVPILMVIYGSLMESGRSGATLGKRAMGIRVADLEGRPIGLGRALLRNVTKSIPLVMVASALLVLGMPRKQGAHDLSAGTVVVKA